MFAKHTQNIVFSREATLTVCVCLSLVLSLMVEWLVLLRHLTSLKFPWSFPHPPFPTQLVSMDFIHWSVHSSTRKRGDEVK